MINWLIINYLLFTDNTSNNNNANCACKVVARLRASSRSTADGGLVNYVIQPGETPEQNGQPRSFYSRIDERSNEMVLLTYRPHRDLLMTHS